MSSQEKKELIPFNAWSKKRIALGLKRGTSRHKRYLYDPRVTNIEKHSWGYIREVLWAQEGAKSPAELQKVIEDIYKRKVPVDEEFYVHWGNFK